MNQNDGWYNVLNGIGESRDITTNTNYNMNNLKSLIRNELNSLYTKNWVATKVVDIPVDDALKSERIYQCEDFERLEIFKECLNHYHIDKKISQLFKWAKVFGSALIVFVTNDDELDKPLMIDSLKENCLKNIIVLDRFDTNSVEIDRNPLSKRYLKPSYYRLNGTSQLIHHSRCVQIDGCETTNWNRDLLAGFGLSIFENSSQELMNATLSPQLLINLVAQSNLDVFKINGLNEALTDKNDDLIIKRLEVIMQSKSIFKGTALDKEDDYINVTKSFAGLNEINTGFMQTVAGVYDIPYTRLMGASATGLNSLGAGEKENYNDKIKGIQKEMREVYEKIDKILQFHLFGQLLDGYKFEFASLFQKTDEETSIINNRDAQTKEIYIRNNVINEIEAKASLIDNPLFPTITAETFEEEKALYEELDNTIEETPKDVPAENPTQKDSSSFANILNRLKGL